MKTAATIPAPAGVCLHLLPDGRTLVEDTHVPEQYPRWRWMLLGPGWQAHLDGWRKDLSRYRPHSGMYLMAWMTAVVSGLCVEKIPAEELARLVELVSRK